ncbi:MAG: TonB-dependent receptor plug domain-containing protein, partial [Thermoanaerobaculia bacterium]
MLMSNSRRFIAVLASLSFLLAGPAISQTDEEQASDEASEETESIDDVITVTARQTEEALRDVPASITVLTDSQIEAVGVQRADDFLKLVPGVSMVNAAEVGDTQVN